MDKCKKLISSDVKKCMKSTSCISIQKNNPLFLESASSILKNVKDEPIIINKSYKSNVKEASLFSYKVVKKIFDKDNGEHEYLIGQTLNELRGEINNFCYTFESSTPSTEFLIEHTNGVSLLDEMKKDNVYNNESRIINNPDLREKYHSIFLQIFLALYIAFNRFGFVHNDLHDENIMITTFETEQWVEYPVRLINKTFCLKTKYFPMIIDYGLSQIVDNKGDIKMISEGFVCYDLSERYCIPIRDWVKILYYKPILSRMLYGNDKTMEIINHPNIKKYLSPYFRRNYGILLASYRINMWKMLESNKKPIIAFYNINYGDIVNALSNTFQESYNQKIIFRDCYLSDFYQKIPTFISHPSTSSIFIEAYIKLLEGHGDGFIEDQNIVSNEVYDELEKIYQSMQPYSISSFRLVNDMILRVQEKASMIRSTHRKNIDEYVKNRLEWINHSIIKY